MVFVLVTGGAKGLGAEICRHLASQGHNVLIHYKTSEEQALQVAQKCRSFGVKAEVIQGDFSSHLNLHAFIEHLLKFYPEIKCLVNNVGNYLIKKCTETTEAEYRALFQTNFFAAIELIQALLPSITLKKGCIINLGVAGLNAIRGDIYSPFYSMTKECLFTLTKSLAKELAPKSVTVNMVSPGYLENAVDLPLNPENFPMGRPGFFYEVARTIGFLMDKESSYVTGQNIEVAGAVRL